MEDNGKEKCSCCNDGQHDDEDQTVMLQFDDGEEIACEMLGIFDVDGKDYIAFSSVQDQETLVFKYTETDGEPVLGDLETEEEFDKVFEALSLLIGEDFDDDDFDDDDFDDDEDDDFDDDDFEDDDFEDDDFEDDDFEDDDDEDDDFEDDDDVID